MQSNGLSNTGFDALPCSLTQAQQHDLITRWKMVKQAMPANVTLLAVSKNKPSSMIKVLANEGQLNFGENYVQEALEKIIELHQVRVNEPSLIWHYIGHIQRNKTKELAQYFSWVQSVDRLIIAQRLNEQRPANLPPLNICIQVNIDDESSKSGCQPEQLPVLVKAISQLPNLRLRGLMIIPAKNSEQAFINTRQLFDEHRQFHAHPEDWDTLSMGMSGDIEPAMAAGSTMVRVGTAIFGTRDYH